MAIVGPRPIRPAFFAELCRGDTAVLAAPGRPPRRHRLRPDPGDPRGVLGLQARPRPGVHRRPLGRPLPQRPPGDRAPRCSARAQRRRARRRRLRRGAAIRSDETARHVRHLRTRGPDGADPDPTAGARDDERAPRPPRPRRRGHVRRRAGRRSAARRLSIIDLADGDQPIANEDGTRRSSSRTARSTTTASCGASWRRSGHRFAHRLRHRGPRPPLRGARRRLRRAAAGDVRVRALGRARQPPAAGPRPLRDQAALLPARRRQPLLRLGAEGDARAAGLLAGDRPARRCRPTSPSTRSRRR